MIEIKTKKADDPTPCLAGAWDMPEAAYHRDPAPAPSLSSSLAKVMVTETPADARRAHPKLNPDWQPGAPTKDMDLGTAAHRMLLEGGSGVYVVKDHSDWRTKDAKDQKAKARAKGQVAVLDADYHMLVDLAAAGREKLARCGYEFERLPSEVTFVYQCPQYRSWRRCRVDALLDTGSTLTVFDYKLTATSPHPGKWGRQAADMGYHIQAAFYIDLLENLYPAYAGRIDFVFLVQNRDTGMMSLNGLAEYDLAVGRRQVAYAIDQWSQCVALDEWPGYPDAICRAPMPEWAHRTWIERELDQEESA